MMSDFRKDVWLGICIGWIVTCILNTMPFSDAAIYRKALNECEKSLPRDQQCVIIGVRK